MLMPFVFCVISFHVFLAIFSGLLARPVIVFLFQQFLLHLRQCTSDVVCSVHFHHSHDSPLYVYFGFNTSSYT